MVSVLDTTSSRTTSTTSGNAQIALNKGTDMGARYAIEHDIGWIKAIVKSALIKARNNRDDYSISEIWHNLAPDIETHIDWMVQQREEQQEEKRKALLMNGPWQDSTDAMVWAEKFVEMNNGKLIVNDSPVAADQEVDAGAMVSWFANAMAAAQRNAKCDRHQIQDSAEVPLMLDIIEAMHRRLGCTRVCDKMESHVYDYIHKKESTSPNPNVVMTPPREVYAGRPVKDNPQA
jgi:hypothetical protein